MREVVISALAIVISFSSSVVHSQLQPQSGAHRPVPAIIVFGDAYMDVGNNNHMRTLLKANFPPYGRDFYNQKPTGRFSNGKVISDFIAESLGFNLSPPAYLNRPAASGANLLIGANFASGVGGYDDRTLIRTIPMSHQLRYYREYQVKLVQAAGSAQAANTIVNKALYLVSAGTDDFGRNYYLNPLVQKLYTPEQYSDFLLNNLITFFRDLHSLGARRIAIISLPPVGCLPVLRSILGLFHSGCISRANRIAQQFNDKMKATALLLQTQLPDLKIAVFDIYSKFSDIVGNPKNYGFKEVARGCCGTGTIEIGVLCGLSIGACTNASEYLFWDSVSPTERAYELLVHGIIPEIRELVS